MKRTVSIMISNLFYVLAFVSALYALGRPEFRDVGIWLIPTIFLLIAGMVFDPKFDEHRTNAK